MAAPLERSRRRWPMVLLAVVVVPLLGFPIILRSFVVEAFQIPSGAMIPTLEIGDHIFVNKTVSRPERGDVIVFKYPMDPQISYVKRVIGLPGDTIRIEKNQLVVNGKPLPRRPRSEDTCSPCLWEEHHGRHTYNVQHVGAQRTDFGPVTVPADNYFVMGDNRDNSNDSRVWGTVPGKLIQGRVSIIWFSDPPDAPVRWGRVGHR